MIEEKNGRQNCNSAPTQELVKPCIILVVGYSCKFECLG